MSLPTVGLRHIPSTGYKIFDRYKACGLYGLHDFSRAPYRPANKLRYQVERAIQSKINLSTALAEHLVVDDQV